MILSPLIKLLNQRQYSEATHIQSVSFFDSSREGEMVLMKYFCFYFPTRLGVIITSVISLVETGVFLIYCIINDVDHFTVIIKGIQENIEEYSSNYVFDKFLEVADSRKNICLNVI